MVSPIMPINQIGCNCIISSIGPHCKRNRESTELVIPGEDEHLGDAEWEGEALPERRRPHDPRRLAVVVHEAQRTHHATQYRVAARQGTVQGYSYDQLIGWVDLDLGSSPGWWPIL